MTNEAQRSRVLRAKGTDPSLIESLLNDALVFDVLKANFYRQQSTIIELEQQYQTESFYTARDGPKEHVRAKFQAFTRASGIWRNISTQHLAALDSSSKDLIQLVGRILKLDSF